MSYFEAYLLWTMGTISGVFGILGAVFLIGGLVCLINYLCHKLNKTRWKSYGPDDCDYCEACDGVKRWKPWLKISCQMFFPIAVILFIFATLIPNTPTVLKIIATKKGVDAVQSDTFTGYLEESGKVIDNSLKLLNQEIEKKISPASKEK